MQLLSDQHVSRRKIQHPKAESRNRTQRPEREYRLIAGAGKPAFAFLKIQSVKAGFGLKRASARLKSLMGKRISHPESVDNQTVSRPLVKRDSILDILRKFSLNFRYVNMVLGLGIFFLLLGGIALFELSSASFTLFSPEISLPPDQGVRHLLLNYGEPDQGLDSFEVPEQDRQALLEGLTYQDYTIKVGDTVSAIAFKNKLRMDTLISVNSIGDVRRLVAGTKMLIPNMDGLVHTIARGDSVESIAAKYNVSVNAILDTNSMESEVISVGQKLFVPDARMDSYTLKKALGELFIYPVSGKFTSFFGMRTDPFTGLRGFHNGLDIANAKGTPVGVAMAGKVAAVGVSATFGRYVIVSHADGFQTWYAHLDVQLVKVGQYLYQGQRVGLLGNTGYSTGPHLHFSIFQHGVALNPLKYLH